jgi:hypothetical protein
LIIPLLPQFLRPVITRVVETSSPFPQLFRLLDVIVLYFADGLYPPEHIEVALKDAFRDKRGILDVSYTTASRTRVGLLATTVGKRPYSHIFTNYNGVGDCEEASSIPRTT